MILIFQVLAKRLAGKSILDMTYLVSSGMLNVNSVNLGDECRCWYANLPAVTDIAVDVQDTKEPACLRLFLDYQGLPLLWSWMVDVPAAAIDFKTQV